MTLPAQDIVERLRSYPRDRNGNFDAVEYLLIGEDAAATISSLTARAETAETRVTALEADIAAYRQSSIHPDDYDHLRKALEAIRDFPKPGTSRRTEDGYPDEIIYDEFAYRRIVDSYREFACAALGVSDRG